MSIERVFTSTERQPCMTKLKIVAALAVAVAAIPLTAALAGFKEDAPLTIDMDQHTAYGAIGSVRNSKSKDDQLTCQVNAYGTSADVLCTARGKDLAGNLQFVTCQSFDAAFVAAAMAVNSDSYISFSWDAHGACQSLNVSTSSSYAPKK
jgi:hypothetical protein